MWEEVEGSFAVGGAGVGVGADGVEAGVAEHVGDGDEVGAAAPLMNRAPVGRAGLLTSPVLRTWVVVCGGALGSVSSAIVTGGLVVGGCDSFATM